jgi:hypothetical protein
MGLHGTRVRVGSGKNGEPGVAEAEAQPPRTTEHVDHRRPRRLPNPLPNHLEICRIGTAGGWLQAEVTPAVMRNGCTASLLVNG